jgi:hypothetical protein
MMLRPVFKPAATYYFLRRLVTHMAILTGAVVIVGALCLVDLLLTFGVIRRLREHTEILAGTGPGRSPGIGLVAGQVPEAFASTDADGVEVTGSAGLSIVAFFSPTCSVCPKRAPAFVDYLRAHRIGRAGVLAVIIGETAAEPVPYLADLTAVARICAEPPEGPIGRAFGVRAVPAFFALGADGAVLAADHDPAVLPAPAAV